MLFLFANFDSFGCKNSGLFLFAKKFRQIFCEQRGKPKIAYYGGVRGLGFFKKEIFCLCFICFVYVYSEENKKVAIMGDKEDSEPIWGKFFSVWENM